MLHERYASLLTYTRDPRLCNAADIVVMAAAVIAFMFVVSGYFALLNMPVYGHDEVHYHEFFHFKLVEDGRWLNYLLHDFLRSVPLPVWSLLYISLWWLLFYRLARNCTFDAPFATLIASTILVASPFLEIALWPASVVPSVLLAWLAVLLHARGIAYQVIYVISGMLMFGAIQTIYFVLPLLFLAQFLDTTVPVRARWLLLFKHMLWWVAGSFAGVLVMSLMLWLLADIYFVQPPAWRATQPVVDIASLFSNIRYVIANFFILLEALLRHGGVTYGFMLTAAAAALLRTRTLWAQAPAMVLLCAVLISFFVFSVPLAPVIHMRSLIAMAIVVILGLAILLGTTALGRMLAVVLLLKMGHFYSVRSHDYLEAHRAETAVYITQLRNLFTGYPMAYTSLALDGTMDPARPEARRFNDSSVMQPLLVSLGVANILDCRIPTRCDKLGAEGEPISVIPFAGGQLVLTVDTANVGIIRYRE